MQKLLTEIRLRSQPFDAVAFISRKYRLTPSRARLVAELAGLRAPDNIPASQPEGPTR